MQEEPKTFVTKMTNNYFIAGDWGTSNLRLYLCEYNAENSSKIIDTRFGSGISELNDNFEETFFNLCQDWFNNYESLVVLLSGMIGSNIGWKLAPYLSCPVDVDQVSQGRVSFMARGVEFSILAGLKTINPLNTADIMRGEELQILGWMNSKPDNQGAHLIALPGTHNKWAYVQGSKISTFLTSFTGELFSLLRQHSILISEDNAFSFNQDAFMQGVKATQNSRQANLMHTLFAVRSRQVLGEISSEDSLTYSQD